MSRTSQAGLGAHLPEAVAYGLLTAVGAGLVVTSFGYGLRTEDGWVGPGFLPLVIGGLLLVLSVLELTRCLRRAPATEPDDGEGTDIFGRTAAERVRQLWTVVAAIAVTVLLVPVLGLPIAFGCLVFFISAWVERRPVVAAAVITGVSVVVVHVVFVTLLGVPLPGGLIGVGA